MFLESQDVKHGLMKLAAYTERLDINNLQTLKKYHVDLINICLEKVCGTKLQR